MKVDRNHWVGHVSALAASGLSGAAYCRQHGLRYNQLSAWKARLAKATVKSKRPSAFVQAKASTASDTPAVAVNFAARLIVGANAAIEFPGSSDPRWVAALVVAIGGHSL
jgi:hypothetical protein